jgi:hypothetical protein
MRILFARYLPDLGATAIVFQWGYADSDPLFGGLAALSQFSYSHGYRTINTLRYGPIHESEGYVDVELKMRLYDHWSVSSVEEFYEKRQWEGRRLANPLPMLEAPA